MGDVAHATPQAKAEGERDDGAETPSVGGQASRASAANGDESGDAGHRAHLSSETL